MMPTTDLIWTEHDTKMCKDGIQSGRAISLKTGKPLTMYELHCLAKAFDKVRDSTNVDDFMEEHIESIHFDD